MWEAEDLEAATGQTVHDDRENGSPRRDTEPPFARPRFADATLVPLVRGAAAPIVRDAEHTLVAGDDPAPIVGVADTPGAPIPPLFCCVAPLCLSAASPCPSAAAAACLAASPVPLRPLACSALLLPWCVRDWLLASVTASARSSHGISPGFSPGRPSRSAAISPRPRWRGCPSRPSWTCP